MLNSHLLSGVASSSAAAMAESPTGPIPQFLNVKCRSEELLRITYIIDNVNNYPLNAVNFKDDKCYLFNFELNNYISNILKKVPQLRRWHHHRQCDYRQVRETARSFFFSTASRTRCAQRQRCQYCYTQD